jgi:RNA polymerase subunit RPABC4/transcription elongation factor Spt4
MPEIDKSNWRACPVCQTVTTYTICPECRRTKWIIRTLTVSELHKRLGKMRADAVGIKAAIAALEGAQP